AVDARIGLNPLTAANAVSTTHTITATVEKDDGLPANTGGGDAFTGFGPAPGETVTFTLTNSLGASASFVGGNTCVTTASGQCTIQIVSPTAGRVTINAGTTLVVSGATLTRDTAPATAPPSGPGGTGPATKDYVDAGITLSPPAATNAV